MKQLYNSDLAQYQRFLGEKTKLRRQVTISVSEDMRHQPRENQSPREWPRGTRERLRSMVPIPVRPLGQRLQAGLGRSTARFIKILPFCILHMSKRLLRDTMTQAIVYKVLPAEIQHSALLQLLSNSLILCHTACG
jgi:hypothetical protein